MTDDRTADAPLDIEALTSQSWLDYELPPADALLMWQWCRRAATALKAQQATIARLGAVPREPTEAQSAPEGGK